MNQILANTIVTYLRSLLALGLGLFSARWVLAALGSSDFGLYAVVGSLMAFAGFLGDLLRVSVSRNFAYAIGRGEDMRTWFGTVLVLHLFLAVVLASVFCPIGEWLVRYVLQVPDGRTQACLWVFRLSLAALCCVTVGIPFGALFTAYQRFGDLAVFGIVQSVFAFGCAYWLLSYPGDRLVCYGAYMAVGVVGVQMIQAIRARSVFDACRFGAVLGASPKKLRDVCSFAGWNALGGGGYLMAMHGSAFATNRLFGSVANAAYGVAQQVQCHTESLAEALIAAFTPAVAERRGAGDRAEMMRLAQQAGLGGAVLLALFALPLALEMQPVLKIWLEAPPAGTAEICTLMLCASVMNKLTMGQQLALAADGRISGWQTTSGMVQLLAVPLTVVLAFSVRSISSAAVAYVIVMLGCVASNLHFGRCLVGMDVRDWMRGTLAPFLLVTVLAAGVGLLPRIWLDAGFARIVVTSALTSVVYVGGGLLWKRLTSH